jgi:hypothetical protein
MMKTEFTSFLIGKILEELPTGLTSAFKRLTSDTIDYRETNFKSRHRCFSCYRIEDGNVHLAPELEQLFKGKRNYHVTKTSDNRIPLPDIELIESRAIEIFITYLLPAMPLRDLDAYAIGINLVRVIANDTNMGSPAPGLHQDGYKFSCHVNVARQNVSGGASLLASSMKPSDVILEHILQPKEFIFFNDITLFHTATPITCRLSGEETWRDMIIVDLVRLQDQ